MAKKSKLIAALDRQKGVDYSKEHQKKLRKQAEKRKRATGKVDEVEQEEEDDDSDDAAQKEVRGAANGDVVDNGGVEGEAWETDQDEEDEEEEHIIDTARLIDSESDSDSDDNMEQNEDEAVEGKAQDEDDIPLSDIESLASEDRGDIIPHQRVTINNVSALIKAHKSFALPLSKLPFSVHHSITSDEPTSIPDIDDDLNRELAFYKQALSAARQARMILKADGVPFSRPVDYFAEMVKSDEHMGRIKQKMVDSAASKKAAQDARRQRDLKKFGKQVQVAKEQERAKAKRETLEKISSLKRKRQGAAITQENEDDIFDVALEDTETTAKKDKHARRTSANGKPNFKRQKRDGKYGFGGKKRFAKSNDATSSSDMRGFSTKKMKGQTKGAPRPGKSRRAKNRL